MGQDEILMISENIGLDLCSIFLVFVWCQNMDVMTKTKVQCRNQALKCGYSGRKATSCDVFFFWSSFPRIT